ncbi:MAG: TIGR00159 family protein [Clostridiales bacterium GWF2_38_85]|nr:MAG: TIGR00159 family protein [Clostridiales bacterium GWF2_38_85]HBL83889.1 TIGR00159 family protein [Clostridiales bacterium]
METLSNFWNYIINQLSSVGISDIIDIFTVAVIFYYSFKFIRDRRAGKVASGVLLMLFILLISDVVGLHTLNFILSNIFQVGLIALIVVFQPELRSALEKIGSGSFTRMNKKFDPHTNTELQRCITEICVAAENLSQNKTGALIALERHTKLGDVIKTGTLIDAVTSNFLICNIFFNKAPLHDGAVIIRNSKIYAAGCFLPLSTNNEIVKTLGTRHRAGLGMSENSDAIIIIVSEETGIISVAIDGVLKRGFSRKSLEEYLNMNLTEESTVETIRSKTKSFINIGGDKHAK